MAVKRIDHIAIVVPDIQEATSFYQDVLGLTLERVEQVDEQEVTIAFFPTGGSEIELLEPLNDTSGVARFLEKRGPGIHHLCLEVDDIRQTLDEMRAAGVELINEEPIEQESGKKLAFVHPRSTGGVLIELYELPPVPQVALHRRIGRLGQRLLLEARALSGGVTAFWNELIDPEDGEPLILHSNGNGITLKAEGEVIEEAE